MFRAKLGVRTRILAIALIPSLTLLVVGVSAAGYVVAEGAKGKEWAADNRKAISPARDMILAVQQERRLTLAQLSGDDTVSTALATARTGVDTALRTLNESTKGFVGSDEAQIAQTEANFNKLIQTMTAVRSGTDAGMLPPNDAYQFFNGLIDAMGSGSKVSQKKAPDTTISARISVNFRMLRVSESMARTEALGTIFATGATPAPALLEEYLLQIGYYHIEAADLAKEDDTAASGRIKKLLESPSWQHLSTMENAIAARATAGMAGAVTSANSGKPATLPPLPMSNQDWHNAAADISRELMDIWTADGAALQKAAEERAAESASNSAWAGGGVLLISVLAFLAALLIANRVSRRLVRLRDQTLAVADEQLPDMMRRLSDGETVDPQSEVPPLDFGSDEIGEVADAFRHAHAAAVTAAVTEARTREGVKAVFLNIAHRSQIVVHRQLEILDSAEREQEDPALLDTLFRLDHLATRERRNAENLIILGGGQPGRQWRNPIPLLDVARSAIGETLDYARVRVARLPEVNVVGTVVADLVHLLAELVDNATSFSPPQSRVEVAGNVVGRGVVVEISDQGMGMPEADLAKANEMLAEPPDFGVATLSADSRLGLFVVARLAVRHGVSVRLSESDYGGIKAIVLIPSALVAAESFTPQTLPELTDPGRRRGLVTAAVQAAPAAEPAQTAPTQTAPAAATQVAEPAAPRYAPPSYTEATPGLGPDGRPSLPRRNRQTSLAPQLAQPAPEQSSPERSARSAEQARDLMSAIENGTRQGRRAVLTEEQEG